MMPFEYTSREFCINLQLRTENLTQHMEIQDVRSIGEFDRVLKLAWDSAQAQGLFRYPFNRSDIPTKILPGKFGFLAQLNPDRALKRRKPAKFERPNQDFNPSEFNFTKVNPAEMIISLEDKSLGDNNCTNVIMINVSPFEFCSVLIIPNLDGNQPQRITIEGLRLALHVILLSNSSDFRIGFNSLCGYASVNHHHYHGYYLKHRLFLEYAELEILGGSCHILVDTSYPAQPFIFILQNCDETSIQTCLESIFRLILYFQQQNVAHNLYMTRGSTGNKLGHFDSIRICIWARKSSYEAKECDAFNPALCELAGHFPIKNESSYAEITEDSVCFELTEICEKEFKNFRSEIKCLFER